MAWDLIFWILASTFCQLLSLSDLEADHLSPFETSARINYVVVPDFLLQGLLCALFLVTWHWFMFLLTLPLTAYNFMLYMNRRQLIDVTEVFRHLNVEKKYRFVKLGFYLILFTVVMFRMFAAGRTMFFISNFKELDFRSSVCLWSCSGSVFHFHLNPPGVNTIKAKVGRETDSDNNKRGFGLSYQFYWNIRVVLNMITFYTLSTFLHVSDILSAPSLIGMVLLVLVGMVSIVLPTSLIGLSRDYGPVTSENW